MINVYDVKYFFGDCMDLFPSISSGSIDMILTDPPYGTTACKWDSVIPYEPMWSQIRRVVKDDAPVVMTASQPFTSKLIHSNLSMFRHEIVWKKNKASNFIRCKTEPMKRHENVLVFSKKRAFYSPVFTNTSRVIRSVSGNNHPRYLTGSFKSEATTPPRKKLYPISVVEFPLEVKPIHPTQKPVSLLKYLIKTYSKPGGTVLDFTCGSGSTLVAAAALGRKAIGIDNGFCEDSVVYRKSLDLKGFPWVEVAKLRVAIEAPENV